MLQPLLQSTTIPLLGQVAKFAERRQEVLAGNIANFDTPGYRMRDLPADKFQQALQIAVAQRHTGHQSPGTLSSLQAPASLHAPETPSTLLPPFSELFPETLFQAETPLTQDHITFQDANNRSVEHQFLKMTQNSMLQQFALEVMRFQFDQLQTVISERL